jgi:hypothetical protein
MSYELADGSTSTDYKIGDEFVLDSEPTRLFVFVEEDLSPCPWFREKGVSGDCAKQWDDLRSVKAKCHTSIAAYQIKQTIRQLKATIKELQQCLTVMESD